MIKMFYENFRTNLSAHDITFDSSDAENILRDIVSNLNDGGYFGIFDTKNDKTLQFAHEENDKFIVDIPHMDKGGSFEGITSLSEILSSLKNPKRSICQFEEILNVEFVPHKTLDSIIKQKLSFVFGRNPKGNI